jgi:hypothetical protein
MLDSQKGEVASSLKTDYENCKKKGMSDDETLAFLKSKYDALVSNMSKRNSVPAKKGKFQRRPTEVGGVGAAAKGKKSGNTRRRSFGQESPTKAPGQGAAMAVESVEPATTMVESASEPIISASPVDIAAQQNDTWDSVVEQPYCEVCQMAFQSAVKLDRHVKFSSLHTSAVAKKAKKAEADAKKAALSPEETASAAAAAAEAKVVKQQEGVDYKLMYSGSKYFWRQKSDIEFHMYMHTLSHTVEVIPFEIAKGREMPRVYLDRYSMDVFVKDDALAHTKAKITASTQGGKYSNNMSKVEEEAMVEDTKRVLIATHIMARLQMDSSGAEPKMQYLPLSGDPDTNSLLDAPNSALVPVPVMRRRRTSNEEIKNKLNDLSLDQEKLAYATNRAQKMADLMQGSVGGFSDVIKRKKKTAESTLTKWGEKWQWACHRIVLQNAVNSYTKQWHAYEDRLKAAKASAVAANGGSKIGMANEI